MLLGQRDVPYDPPFVGTRMARPAGSVDRLTSRLGLMVQFLNWSRRKPSSSSRQAPRRGRQLDSSISPDNVWKAVSRNGNILLEGVDTERWQVVTVEGRAF